MVPDMTDQYCSVKEAADLLGVTPRTIINLLRRGRFTGAYKLDPEAARSTWRIPRQEVDKFLRRRTKPLT